MSLYKNPVITLTTGPVDCYPSVLAALGRPVLYDYDPAFQATYERVSYKVQDVFRSSSMPVILHGEPVLALEAAAASLLAKGDVVLNLVSGVYGAGFAFWAARYCKQVLEVCVPYNEVIDPQMVADMLAQHPEIAVVVCCHHDTPSGTINPVKEIGAVVAKHGALFMIDAVSSFGGMDILPEAVQADMFVTGPNKCLGCPPGLSLLNVSDRAWAKMKANPDAPQASMLSILDWEHAWSKDQPFPFTPSVAEINGLEAALDHYLEEGEQAVWHRHAVTAAACRAGVLASGLSLWAASESIASPTATAVRMPDGIDAAVVIAEARKRYGVMFSSGRGETLGKLLRIGHMGPTAQPIYASIAVNVLVSTLIHVGAKNLDLAAASTAVMKVIDQSLVG